MATVPWLPFSLTDHDAVVCYSRTVCGGGGVRLIDDVYHGYRSWLPFSLTDRDAVVCYSRTVCGGGGVKLVDDVYHGYRSMAALLSY